MLLHIINSDTFKQCYDLVKTSLFCDGLYWRHDVGEQSAKSMAFSTADRYPAHKRREIADAVGKREAELVKIRQGELNHFLNVVAVLARLIQYFSRAQNVEEMFKGFHQRLVGEDSAIQLIPDYALTSEFCHNLSYRQADQRTLKLMMAGFFHDLGKTVESARHGRGGYILLADDSTKRVAEFSSIASSYDPEWAIDIEDVHFIAALVNYHDLFGTMTTGESGYLCACNILQRIKRYSLWHRSAEKQRLWAQRHLFDLWLLNIADIMVSIKAKDAEQQQWQIEVDALREIEQFLIPKGSGAQKVDTLLHDLFLLFDLLDVHNQHHHSADIFDLQRKAYEYSRSHAIEILRRFINEVIAPLAVDRSISMPARIMIGSILEQATEEHLNAAIIRAINTMCPSEEFFAGFAWIGQMDYALGFFRDIIKNAVEHVSDELTRNEAFQGGHGKCSDGQVLKTGWVRGNRGDDFGNPESVQKTEQLFFLYNMTWLVVQVIGYIVKREAPLDRLRNLEFSEARKRLREIPTFLAEKIIGLEGPYRAARSRELLLETVYVY